MRQEEVCSSVGASGRHQGRLSVDSRAGGAGVHRGRYVPPLCGDLSYLFC